MRGFGLLSRACALLMLMAAAPALALAERVVETNPTAIESDGPVSYRHACITLHDLDFGLAAPPVEIWSVGEEGAVEATLLPDGSYVLGGLGSKVEIEFFHPLYGKARLEASLGDAKFCHLIVSLGSDGAQLLACAPISEARAIYQLEGHQSEAGGGAATSPLGPTTKAGASNAEIFSKTLSALDLPCLPGDGDDGDAPILAGEGIFTGDLADNTGAIDHDSAGLNNTIDEWLCYSASCTGNVTVTTCMPGTEFDTVLSAWTDVEISSNDDALGAPAACTLSGLNRFSTINFEAVAGEAYLIRVSAFNDSFTGLGAYGTGYQLSIACDTLQGVDSDCCKAHDSVGCDDNDCEALICGLDAVCCQIEWDQFCATSAQALCDECGNVGGGDCCEAHEGIGCEDDACMAAVCAQDPICCAEEWDDLCAQEAGLYCADLCATDPCSSSTDSCFEAHDTPGCSDASCCNEVCATDFFCCVLVWDEICVGAALVACPAIAGACCVDDLVGGCIDTTEDGCADAGGVFQGVGTVCGTEGCLPPSNDQCETATPILVLPATVSGSTAGATIDSDAPTCGATITSPGVWYRVIGTGTTITASTCDQAEFDTKLSVYCGECHDVCLALGASDLVCVIGVEDSPGCSNGTTTVTWCSDANIEYLILVHGFGGESGSFDLTVSAGDPCAPTGTCVPIGACCFCVANLTETHSCIVTTEELCVNSGGVFLGADSTCGAKANYAQFVGAAIPDNSPGGVSNTIDVAETFTVTNVNVDLTITHFFVGDLCVEIAHAGTTVLLIQRSGANVAGQPCHLGSPFGCSQDNYAGIILDDEGTGGSIENACALNLTSPPNYVPFEALSGFNGLDSAGAWTITVSDNASGDLGTFLSWSLHFEGVGTDPCAAECPGACCVPNPGCVELTETQCSAAGGEFQGAGIPCTEILAIVPGGACCFANGECDVLSETDCTGDGGVFQGVGIPCTPCTCDVQQDGACCFASGSCDQTVTADECAAAGGAFLGGGTTCDECIGACCFVAGTCLEVNIADCAAAPGIFQGFGTSCSTSPCIGACCFSSGGCDFVTAEECVAATGFFQGVGTDCTPNPCNVACCLANGSCQELSLADCVGAAGTFFGFGSSCTQNTCQGACCVQDECQFLDVDSCAASGGEYQGFPTFCSTTPCPPPTGACCFSNGSCQDLTALQCAAVGGFFQSGGCAPSPCVAGCCLPDGSCQLLNLDNCTASNGVYQGFPGTCEGAMCPQPPTGACCFTDGSCQVLTVAQCGAEGGSAQTAGSTCTDNFCRGACCFEDGSCQFINGESCGTAGGEFQGFPSLCETAQCPQPPTGACCATSGDCALFTEVACAAVSGAQYQGDGTSCTPNPCDQPTGACCFLSGVCDVLSAVECGALNGNFVGVGVPCTPNPCPQPTGACCFAGGGCDVLTTQQCAGSNGVFQGAGIPCTPNPCTQPPQRGACCYANGGCDFITAGACAAAGGTFQGVGIPCTPSPCNGACCLPNGACIGTNVDNCTSSGGVFHGVGAPCSPNPCPEPDGACCLCFDGQTCVELGDAECDAADGTFLGTGSSCNGEALDVFDPCLATCCTVIDFEQKEDGTPLPNGAVLNNSFWPSLFTIQSSGFNAGPAVFDSTQGGPNQNSDDPDLLVNTGNLGILQNNLHAGQTGGIFNSPDDDSTPGGVLRFNFVHLVQVRSVDLIDIDEGGACTVKLFDDNGKTRTYNVQDFFTTNNQGGIRTLDLTILGVQQGVDGNAVGTQQSGFNEHRVVRLDFNFGGSAAIDNLVICPRESDD